MTDQFSSAHHDDLYVIPNPRGFQLKSQTARHLLQPQPCFFLYLSHGLIIFQCASSPFNDTYIAQLRNASETCGYNDYIAKALTFPPSGHFEDPVGIKKNGNPTADCEIFGSIFEEIFWINPCWVRFLQKTRKRLANSI